MRVRNGPWRLTEAFTGAILLCASGGNLPAQVQTTSELQLIEGNSFRRSMRGGERHSFSFAMSENQFVHIVIEQRGIDVVAEIVDPGKQVVYRQDTPNDAVGPECVAYIAHTSGEFALVVSTFSSSAAVPEGNLDIKINAVRSATTTDQRHALIETWLSEGGNLRRQNTLESRPKALELFNAALKESESLSLQHETAVALYSIGLTFLRGGQTREAVPSLSRLVPILREAGSSMYANASNALGGAYDVLGDVVNARRHYEQALEYFRRNGAISGEGVVRNNLGKTYADAADWQQALIEYRLALPLFKAAGDQNRQALAYYNIGMAHMGLGDGERAFEYLHQALAIRVKTGDRAGQADALTSIGRVQSERGELPAAVDSLRKALTLREAIGDERSEGFTRTLLGRAYFDSGNSELALTHLDRAMSSRVTGGDRRGAAATQLVLAEVQARTGDQGAAIQSAVAALATFKDLGDDNNVARALRQIGESSGKLGHLEEALNRFQEASAAVERVRGRVSNPELRATLSGRQHDIHFSHVNGLMMLHETSSRPEHLAAALETNERGRARSLIDMLSESKLDIRRGVDSGLVKKERDLVDVIGVKSERLMLLLARDKNSSAARALLQDVNALGAELEEVQSAIRKESPEYAALVEPKTLDISQLQQLLDENTCLIEYSLGEEASYAWIMCRDAIRGVRLASRRNIEDSARQVSALITARGASSIGETAGARQLRIAGSDESYKDALRRLSHLAVTSLGGFGDATRLLVVADGALQYVPFAMLLHQASTNEERTLIADYEIVTMPSASVLAVQRDRMRSRASPSAGIAVIADPVFDRTDARLARSSIPVPTASADTDDTTRILEHLSQPAAPATSASAKPQSVIPRLPFTRNEADAILSVAKGQKNFRAVDFAATKDAVLGGALKDYRIIHFATHGFLDTERPTLSSIVLSLVDRNGKPRDGFLRAQELYNMELNADLVVLSACQTGLGKSIEGEGLIGLTRGLMYAGAQRVVVSLWNVSDRATAALMTRFYQEMLVAGKPPSAALRAAQLEIMKIKGWESPYYWAPFIMQGDWR